MMTVRFSAVVLMSIGAWAALGVAAAGAGEPTLSAIRAEALGRDFWRLTLAFEDAEAAPGDHVEAPPLTRADISIRRLDSGRAAPFVIHEIEAPGGAELVVRVEYFGRVSALDDPYVISLPNTAWNSAAPPSFVLMQAVAAPDEPASAGDDDGEGDAGETPG